MCTSNGNIESQLRRNLMFYPGKRVCIADSKSEHRDFFGVVLEVYDEDQTCLVDVGGEHIEFMMCDLL